MSQQPSMFGEPAGPAATQPAVTVDTPTNSRRTVVLAVAGAVVTLGVLGGAAALVLNGDDGTDVAAPLPAATPSVEPSVEPSSAPTVPLPTSAVQGRNIFVPLLDVPAVAVAGADPAAAPAASATSTDLPATASTAGAGTSSVGTTSAVNGSPVSSEMFSELIDLREQLASRDQEIETLRESLLDLGGSFDERTAELEVLLAEAIEKERVAREELEAFEDEFARLRFVTVVDVDPETTVLQLVINGEPVKLDLIEPDPDNPSPDREDPSSDLPNSVVLGTTPGGVEVELTFKSYDPVGSPDQVSLGFVSALYTVSEGATLKFSV